MQPNKRMQPGFGKRYALTSARPRVILTLMQLDRRVHDVQFRWNQRLVIAGVAGFVADDGDLGGEYAVADTPDMQIRDTIGRVMFDRFSQRVNVMRIGLRGQSPFSSALFLSYRAVTAATRTRRRGPVRASNHGATRSPDCRGRPF